MTALPRTLVALACSLVALPLVSPLAAADLTVDTHSGTSYDIYTHGSSSLASPQNTTIAAAWGGYILSWSPPTAFTSPVTGYLLYRVPGPNTAGSTQVTHLSPRWTTAYDRPTVDGTYVYFVTATYSGATANSAAVESVPGRPVATLDTINNYPHCNVMGIYFSPPYYDTHLDCLFPLA